MNPTSLSTEVQIYERLKKALLEQYKLETDDQVLLDTLDGATTLVDQLVSLVRQVQEDECTIDGLQKRINQMQERKSRLIARAEKFRGMVSKTMVEVDIKKLVQPDMTISVKMGQQPLVILRPPDIQTPVSFTKKLETYSWDRAAVRAALERNDPRACEVAKFGEAEPILTVHTK